MQDDLTPTPPRPARRSESVAAARLLVKKWAERFGFAHYSYRVKPLPKKLRGEYYALCEFDHEEESFGIEIVPDGTLPARQLEYVVIHEMTHGLVSYAAQHDVAEETICNRIARAFTRSAGPNEHASRHGRVIDPQGKAKAMERVVPDRLRDLIDKLPPVEAAVLSLIYYGRYSLREVAQELGLHDKWAARAVRDRALRRLREARPQGGTNA